MAHASGVQGSGGGAEALGDVGDHPRKTQDGTHHPDTLGAQRNRTCDLRGLRSRNAQFEHINAQVRTLQAAGQPAIPADTTKKELIGDFKNAGRGLRP